jgi:ABC-2 type transport system permease protein
MQVRLADSGRVVDEGGIFFLLMLPLIFAILLMTSSVTTSGFLMSGLVEEKTNRIIEVLVTSVTPMQLLAGKIVGLCLLGLTQVLILIASGVIGLAVARRLEAIQDVIIPVDLAVLGIVYYLLSYFLLAAFLAGIGAVAGSEQESRQFSAILTIPFMLPLFVIVNFILDPNGPLPVILSLVPITAPMSMLLRIGITNVPTWQIVASLAILALTVLVTVWLSARMFRWGLLLYGKRLDLRQIARVILRRNGAQMATSAAHSTGSTEGGVS